MYWQTLPNDRFEILSAQEKCGMLQPSTEYRDMILWPQLDTEFIIQCGRVGAGPQKLAFQSDAIPLLLLAMLKHDLNPDEQCTTSP